MCLSSCLCECPFSLFETVFLTISLSSTRLSSSIPSFYSTTANTSDQKSSEPKPEDAQHQSNGAPANEQQAANEPNEREKKLVEENEKLAEKVKIIDDNFKRALADSENFRMRKNKEIEDTKKFAIQGFAKDLLEVADILRMAIDAVPKDQISSNAALKSLFEGVQMTEKQLQSIFRRHGIVQINPIGEKFNPNEHDALCYVEDKTKIADTVFVVNKIGYKLKERVIRAAAVGVVKN